MKHLFAITSTILLVAVLAYLQLSFRGADVKTAIRLVEEAKAFGVSLKARMARVMAEKDRLCEAETLREFHGHMEVVCRDLRSPAHILRWRVSVIDGMVQPISESAIRLGKGEDPWPISP